MEQKQAKNDQQATNAALAALAAAGNTFALGQLWEVNKGFIRRQLWQWYEKNKPVADNAGLSFEDLVQEGYFAVDYAAKHYSAEQGNFTTYLSYAPPPVESTHVWLQPRTAGAWLYLQTR